MANVKPKIKEPIIQPTMTFNDGMKHPMEILFEGDNPLTIKSIGYVKLPKSNDYVSYVMTSQGKEILKIEVDEPNARAIAEESAKIAFAKEFMDGEE